MTNLITHLTVLAKKFDLPVSVFGSLSELI